jgi:hypothetical protein
VARGYCPNGPDRGNRSRISFPQTIDSMRTRPIHHWWEESFSEFPGRCLGSVSLTPNFKITACSCMLTTAATLIYCH